MDIWFPRKLFIGNSWCAGTGTDIVYNPATEEAVTEVAIGGLAEAQQAVDAAAEAFPAWRDTPPTVRGRYLAAIRDVLLANTDRLAELLTLENGKPITQARVEIQYAASFFDWYSQEARRLNGRRVPHADPAVESWVEHEPVGVVGLITPWNFPLAQGAKKLSAALAAGCTAVLKPAPDTPLLSLVLGWVAEQVDLPAGVLNIVNGNAAEIAEVFYEDFRVRCISLTGSVQTGALVGGHAGAKLKHVCLELGGNSPFIVYDDADLDHTLTELMKLKLMTNGQTCVTANRIFVQDTIAERFTDQLLERVRQVKLKDPSSEDSDLGPLINQAGLDKVRQLEQSAIEAGARLRHGGYDSLSGFDRGTWYPLSLITDVTNEMEIAQTEIFGPILALQTFEDEADVIERANATTYGLAGYVYGGDESRLRRTARRLEVGIAGINDMRPLRAEVPFGGVKNSGIGKEGGLEGLHDYTVAKTYSLRRV